MRVYGLSSKPKPQPRLNETLPMPDTEHHKFHSASINDTTGATILKYWPMIVALATVLLSLGAIYTKLEYISKAIDRTDSQFTQLNGQMNLAGQSIIEIRGQVQQTATDNARNAQSIAELRGRLDLLSDKARWAPGGK
jgi:septal ring factor EnvC (AmiA/AmiB activator)